MDFQQQFMDFLYNNQNATFQELCGFAEKKTGLEREKVSWWVWSFSFLTQRFSACLWPACPVGDLSGGGWQLCAIHLQFDWFRLPSLQICGCRPDERYPRYVNRGSSYFSLPISLLQMTQNGSVTGQFLASYQCWTWRRTGWLRTFKSTGCWRSSCSSTWPFPRQKQPRRYSENMWVHNSIHWLALTLSLFRLIRPFSALSWCLGKRCLSWSRITRFDNRTSADNGRTDVKWCDENEISLCPNILAIGHPFPIVHMFVCCIFALWLHITQIKVNLLVVWIGNLTALTVECFDQLFHVFQRNPTMPFGKYIDPQSEKHSGLNCLG